MNFNVFDKKMRLYEISLDQCVLPEIRIIARLDGRGFTKLTHNMGFRKPFDTDFSDIMVGIVEHLMKESGFKVSYGYTQSDEISLLLAGDDTTFNHKTRKLNSVLAGMASSFFTLKVNTPAVFDCRVVPVPNEEVARDYFLWRQEDANRNALNSWCYWMLRENGKSRGQATKELMGKTVSDKNQMLFDYGINYNDLPKWQKRGVGVYFTPMMKLGHNKKTGETTMVKRKSMCINTTLPVYEKYSDMIGNIFNNDILTE